MKRRERFLLTILVSLFSIFLILSCFEDRLNSNEIFFLGDSHVEFWDVQFDFPMFLTHNMGVKGCGIESIKDFAHTMSGKIVVVIVGTNDLKEYIVKGTELDYVSKYMNVIQSLDADKTIVVSIFPQTNVDNSLEVNERIMIVNDLISSSCLATKITFVDMSDLFFSGNKFNPLYSDDGRHPNRLGYERISIRVKDAIH